MTTRFSLEYLQLPPRNNASGHACSSLQHKAPVGEGGRPDSTMATTITIMLIPGNFDMVQNHALWYDADIPQQVMPPFLQEHFYKSSPCNYMHGLENGWQLSVYTDICDDCRLFLASPVHA